VSSYIPLHEAVNTTAKNRNIVLNVFCIIFKYVF
jgi:hypothetical protein